MDNIIQRLKDAYSENPAKVLELLPKLFNEVDEGKIVVLPDKAHEEIQMVECALQITLYDWQKAYIWGGSGYMAPGRRTGKTLAHMIKLCLSKGEPINLFKKESTRQYVDEWHGTQYLDWYRHNLRSVYENLKRQPLHLRKICFTREAAEKALEEQKK